MKLKNKQIIIYQCVNIVTIIVSIGLGIIDHFTPNMF